MDSFSHPLSILVFAHGCATVPHSNTQPIPTHRVCIELCNGGRVQRVLRYGNDDTRLLLLAHTGKEQCLYPVTGTRYQVHLLPITWDTIMVGNELGNVLSDDGYATGV